MVLMGSANHDERVFPRPEAFDLFRTFGTDNKILTFGEGIHSCMGSPIARLMAEVVVEEPVDHCTTVLPGDGFPIPT